MSEGFASYPGVTYDELMTKMQANTKDLPRQEAKIAQYILLNSDSVQIETGKSIAQKAGVAEVTVGRLLRRLGCDGMKEFKQLLRRRYSAAGGMPERQQEVPNGHLDTLDAELRGIRAVFEQINGADFQTACSCLSKAKSVHVTGFQSVRGLAEDAARRLAIARDDVRFVSAHDGMLAEWIEGITAENTCLLMVDVVPYAAESKHMAELAAAQGRKVVIVCDEYCHWARDYADAVIYAPTATGLFLESTLGLNMAFALLCNSVALDEPDRSNQRLSAWKSASRKLGIF